MTRFISPYCKNRLLAFESLEPRTLLANDLNLDLAQEAWPEFVLDDSAIVHEIAAADLSAASLQSVIELAASSPEDDLIILHTTDANHTITFTEDSEFVIDLADKGRLTIISQGTQNLTIDAAQHGRLFCVRSGEVQLGGLVLAHGRATSNLQGQDAFCGLGGGLANAGTTTLAEVTVRDCTAESALFNPKKIATFSYYSKGGAIYNEGTLTICDSRLTGNTARSSGLDPLNNTVLGAGGALYSQGGTVVIRDSIVSDNTAEAGILTYVVLSGDDTITKTVQQQGTGGAIYQAGGSLSINGGQICGNTAYHGGGLALSGDASLTLMNASFERNQAKCNGGALYCLTATASIIADRSDFFANVATGDGGAIYCQSGVTVRNSVFSGNKAGDQGGALALTGKYVKGAEVVEFQGINCTITGNEAGTSGGALFFSGTDDTGIVAKLYVKNSILVKNRVTGSLANVAPNLADPNLAKANSGDYCFGYYTLTTFTQWRLGSSNPSYSEDEPLFSRDYQFTTGAKGDYRLKYDPNSQAIDAGSASYVETEFDFNGKARIQGVKVDLGAMEHCPSSFDGLFPNDLHVSQGTSFVLNAAGSDSLGSTITHYLVDLDGDGQYDRRGATLWISWSDLSWRADGWGYLSLAMENSLGETSEFQSVAVAITEVQPCISVRPIQFYKEQILKLCLTASYCDRSPRQWTINWGDGTSPVTYNCWSTCLTATHYYDPQAASKTYDLTLSLVDSNGHGGEITYYIGSHTVPAGAMSAAAAARASLPSDASVSGHRNSAEGEIASETTDLAIALMAASLPVVQKNGSALLSSGALSRSAAEMSASDVSAAFTEYRSTAAAVHSSTRSQTLESFWNEGELVGDWDSAAKESKIGQEKSDRQAIFAYLSWPEVLIPFFD
ncbi:MAG: choice-of-anchor Q domain-containing protein [Planctomycetia bacterium]|nr:choice-of-anchor Q domain-containing protein [Planctomycetia bacterium]